MSVDITPVDPKVSSAERHEAIPRQPESNGRLQNKPGVKVVTIIGRKPIQVAPNTAAPFIALSPSKALVEVTSTAGAREEEAGLLSMHIEEPDIRAVSLEELRSPARDTDTDLTHRATVLNVIGPTTLEVPMEEDSRIYLGSELAYKGAKNGAQRLTLSPSRFSVRMRAFPVDSWLKRLDAGPVTRAEFQATRRYYLDGALDEGDKYLPALPPALSAIENFTMNIGVSDIPDKTSWASFNKLGAEASQGSDIYPPVSAGRNVELFGRVQSLTLSGVSGTISTTSDALVLRRSSLVKLDELKASEADKYSRVIALPVGAEPSESALEGYGHVHVDGQSLGQSALLARAFEILTGLFWVLLGVAADRIFTSRPRP